MEVFCYFDVSGAWTLVFMVGTSEDARTSDGEELAGKVSASMSIIGKYERNENQPSIEMALKIAKAFDITVDFLLGEGDFASYDKETLARLENIQKMDDNTRSVLFNLIDTYIQNFKTKQAFATGK